MRGGQWGRGPGVGVPISASPGPPPGAPPCRAVCESCHPPATTATTNRRQYAIGRAGSVPVNPYRNPHNPEDGEVGSNTSEGLKGLVPEVGLEPTRRADPRGILSPVRLPIPPLRHQGVARLHVFCGHQPRKARHLSYVDRQRTSRYAPQHSRCLSRLHPLQSVWGALLAVVDRVFGASHDIRCDEVGAAGQCEGTSVGAGKVGARMVGAA
jgi:hypothetical protein